MRACVSAFFHFPPLLNFETFGRVSRNFVYTYFISGQPKHLFVVRNNLKTTWLTRVLDVGGATSVTSRTWNFLLPIYVGKKCNFCWWNIFVKLRVGSRAKFFFSFRFGGARCIEPRNLGCEIWYGVISWTYLYTGCEAQLVSQQRQTWRPWERTC